MAQKKKATKPTKKQLKQRQRQYQKQSVVVNVNTATKRRRATGKKPATVSAGATSGSFATQLIQTVPLQYSPQTMLDQSSILSQDSRNRIFQSEIRNGISFMNEEREKNVANNNKREAWLTQQENIINENRLMGDEDVLSRNMLPTPRDSSIPAINATGSNSVVYTPDTTAPIRVIKKRNPPMFPPPVDRSINMNAPAAAVEEPEPPMERGTTAYRGIEGKRPRNYNYPEFTLLPNGKWRCNTCDPIKDVEKGSRGKHLDTKIHERNLSNPRPPFRV